MRVRTYEKRLTGKRSQKINWFDDNVFKCYHNIYMINGSSPDDRKKYEFH